ncbi:hypothetical protein JCM24511_06240 [Saitozyma sp. JCM 24511]|nr:hypothetical protein JCM24511_06240 [Saitozyma sp. JCM 24511]
MFTFHPLPPSLSSSLSQHTIPSVHDTGSTPASEPVSHLDRSYKSIHHYAQYSYTLFGANIIFMCLITTYKFYVRRENRRLDAGGEEAKKAMRHGVTQEQVDLGWRYVGY